MAEFGNHCFSEGRAELAWAYTYQQPTEFLIVLKTSDAPHAFAILSSSNPSCNFSYEETSGTNVIAQVKLSQGTDQNWTLTYKVTISLPQNDNEYSGVLAHIMNPLGVSSTKQKESVSGGKKR